MKMIFKCGNKVVNQHSSRYKGWNNPFSTNMPMVGDYVLLGEHTAEFKHLDYAPMEKYVVKSRTFSAIEDYNNCYSDQTCVFELEHLPNAIIN